jgi:hypothetical protein
MKIDIASTIPNAGNLQGVGFNAILKVTGIFGEGRQNPFNIVKCGFSTAFIEGLIGAVYTV